MYIYFCKSISSNTWNNEKAVADLSVLITLLKKLTDAIYNLLIIMAFE